MEGETIDLWRRPLRDRTALITGGTRGIGAAIAVAMADAGAHAVISGRNAVDGGDLVSGIVARGGRASYVACDLEVDADVEALVRQTLSRCGKFDVLVNNAAIDAEGPALDYALGDWRRIMRFNVEVPFRLSVAAARHFLGNGGGAIINISSVLGQIGGVDECAYATSKHALNGMTKALAIEWASRGVRVNAIAPGLIRTEMSKEAWTAPTINDRIALNYPVGRIGEPRDVAGLAVFLASDAADFVHGQIFAVDGGRTA